MNPIPIERVDDQNVVDFAESPGRRLRLQRQSRGLEIERIATQLHLRPERVESLEQDRYDDLPGPVFVAGYIRNYARLLGMDPDPLVAAYRGSAAGATPQVRRVLPPTARETGSGQILVRLISLALLAAVIGMLVYWWQNRDDLLPSFPELQSETGAEAPRTDLGEPAEPPAETAGGVEGSAAVAPTMDTMGSAPAAASLPETAISGGPAPLDLRAVPTSQTPQTPQTPVTDTSAAASEPLASAAQESPETAETPSVASPPEIALSFSGPCWIDVRDAGGASVLTGEMAKGDRRVLEGEAPFSFVIGNVTATTMTVGGEPFDLVGRSRGNVARFKFNPESDE